MSDAALAEDQSRRVARGGKTPEQEIEDARQTLQRKDRQIADLTDTNAKLAGDAGAHAKAASESEIARITERESTLNTAIASAKTTKDAAIAAKRAARDAGNIDAEIEADEALTSASVRFETLNMEKSNFDAAKPRLLEAAKKKAETPARTVAKPSAESQKWLDDHPEYHTNALYRSDATEAHKAAIEVGIQAGTPQYIEFINAKLERLHGKGHGKPKSQDGDRDDHRGAGSAAGPSRDSDGAQSVSVDGSNLRVTRGSDGKRHLTGNIPASWRDGAKWCGMDEVEYALQQIDIDADKKAGRDAGLQTGDGMIYR